MSFRRVLPMLGFALCAAWLVVAFTPLIPKDNHGYNQLMAMIVVTLLFIPLAVVASVCSVYGFVSWRFSISLLAVAPIHGLAAGIEAPLCTLLFLLPLVAVVVFGVQTAWASYP
jgi:hypothetical protein